MGAGGPWFLQSIHTYKPMSLVTWALLGNVRSGALVQSTYIVTSWLIPNVFHLPSCRRSTRLASKRGSDSSSHSLESSHASAVSDPGEHTDTETRVRGDVVPEGNTLRSPNHYGHLYQPSHYIL